MKLTNLSLILVSRACAGVSIALCMASTNAATAYYFDGGTQRIVTLEPKSIAQFKAPSAVGARAAGAGGPFVTLVDTAQPGLKSVVGATSPVYRQGNSPAGPLMALPGGVLVNFKLEWTAAQVHAWALAGGYTLGQRMPILGTWYVLKTAPGNVALETANTLQRTGLVVSATPNWWMQTAAR